VVCRLPGFAGRGLSSLLQRLVDDPVQTFGELRRIRPEIKVILSSGYNEQDATRHFAGRGLTGFIQKPYNLLTLRKKLMEVLTDDKA